MSLVRQRNMGDKILIVDDNATNVALLHAMLEISGYTNVSSTTDSRLVKSLQDDNQFDLILLDIRMPHLDGFQVMEQLCCGVEDDYLPILVLTAQKDMETKLRALECGAKDFVSKPFDNTEVINRIGNMLEVRDLYNQKIKQTSVLEKAVRDRTQQLIQRNKELEESHLEAVRSLGRAGEYRDNETGNHVIRMSMYCQEMALAAGWSQRNALALLHASPMHDVGKIGIPDNILLKPGGFQPDEWEIMKTHVAIGVEIIGKSTSPLSRFAKSIAQHHHEKWDGSGYPQGMKGKDIPQEGRIAAICDVFDALTSARPYKEAWPVPEAVELINQQSGSHFDPELIPLFNQILPSVNRIRNQYPD